MLVLADERRVLCIYPYRDSDSTKITLQTRDAVIIGYGAPGIGADQLKEAVGMTLDYIKRFSSGRTELVEVFESSQTG
jgi:DNA/RNA-binding domain of Phe-tRNA-synthetase-like protein